MAKRKTIRIEVSPNVRAWLKALVRTGLYGTTVEEVAERLLCLELVRMLKDPPLGTSGSTP